jgi:sugar transferase (PEP-CTERM system associated)
VAGERPLREVPAQKRKTAEIPEKMLKIGGQKVAPQILWLLVCDAAVIVAALLLAVVLRQPEGILHFPQFDGLHTFWRFAVVVVVCILSLYYYDLYESQILHQHSKLFMRLVNALAVACTAIALIYYFLPILSIGRGVAALAAPILISSVLGARLVIEHSGGLIERPERVLIVGTDTTGIQLTREILKRPELALKVVGFLDEKGENLGKSLVNPCIIGGVADVRHIVESEKIDRVVLALSERRGTTPVDALLRLKVGGLSIEDSHSCYERVMGRILLERLTPSWLILSDGFGKSGFLLGAKRLIDVIVSLVGLLLVWPLMLIVALAIWCETGKPLLFRQKRIGLHGKEFEIVKFRSMRQDAEAAGPAWATANDNRITPLGSFLRKYRLDEFPQLINVLRGDMSLVGPRPEQPHFCKLLSENVPYFEQRHSVRPGITGWAQVKYQYGATVNESKIKLELDLFYIKHLSIFLDLAILFETGKVMVVGRGAQ